MNIMFIWQCVTNISNVTSGIYFNINVSVTDKLSGFDDDFHQQFDMLVPSQYPTTHKRTQEVIIAGTSQEIGQIQ